MFLWRVNPFLSNYNTCSLLQHGLPILQVGKRQWERVLDMVGKIRGLNMEVCTTLGMLTPEQAAQLRTAGLTAYNHNLDTSPEYYPKVTSSRKYQVDSSLHPPKALDKVHLRLYVAQPYGRYE